MGLGVTFPVVRALTCLFSSHSTGDVQAQVQVAALQMCTHPLRCLLLQETEVSWARMCAGPWAGTELGQQGTRDSPARWVFLL